MPEMSLNAALSLARGHLQDGRLEDAEGILQAILRTAPLAHEAYRLLGGVAYHRQEFDRAIGLIERALAIRPGVADYHNNLSVVFAAWGKPEEAESAARQALALRPGCPDAETNLGIALAALGRIEEAEAAYRRALASRPGHPATLNILGEFFRSQGRLAEAESMYRDALASQPGFADAHNNLGNLFLDQGRTERAAESFREAIRLDPRLAQARNNLGNALLAEGRAAEAVAAYEQALAIRPEFAEASSNLASSLLAVGRFGDAEAACRRSLSRKPDLVQAQTNLARALENQGRLTEAVRIYEGVIAARPDFVEAYVNLGNTLRALGRLDDAVDVFRNALELKPDNAQAHNNLAAALKGLGRIAESRSAYDRALAIQPDFAAAQSNRLLALNYDPAIDPHTLFVEHQQWGNALAHLAREAPPHHNAPDPLPRLRIGYVSPDFRQHAVARFVEPFLAGHDPAEFETFCYAQVLHPDDWTRRFQALAHHWRSTCGLSDSQAADMIRADQIDILVDLAGHTAGNRLGVLARKPAPVQMTWMGYPNTTGLAAIDYWVTDEVLNPPANPIASVEEPLRLAVVPCFSPPAESPPVGPLPALERGSVTFGSPHNLAKLNQGLLDAWGRILRAAPGSRLLAFRGTLTPTAQEWLWREFGRRGIERERIELRQVSTELSGYGSYLATYGEIDVCLDTFPSTAGTTSYESLWMGAPMLTRYGDRYFGRLTSSVLIHAGLSEWVCRNEEEYESKAIGACGDVVALSRLRQGLRERMRETVCDAGRFIRHLEQAYRTVWRRWCNGRD